MIRSCVICPILSFLLCLYLYDTKPTVIDLQNSFVKEQIPTYVEKYHDFNLGSTFITKQHGKVDLYIGIADVFFK